MTGITVQSGTGTIKDGGTVNIDGPGNIRIDHCHLIASSSANYKMLRIGVGIFGVMDHCIIDLTGLNLSTYITVVTARMIGWGT